ncbi:MAG: cation transporter [Spirochaetaceae bacterium]|nr:cation transporter [Spirochaetaceae bacterium]MBO7485910.1 cation transporter [Spirochaetaceae bacterium]
MEKKIYVVGLDDANKENQVNTAVSAVAGVSSCTANSAKAQVLVVFDEGTAGIEDAINAAISAQGVDVLN